jgi:predicted amidohydrolase
MKIAIYQFSPVFGEKEKNLNKIKIALSQIRADLIVLPELCTTGYQFVSHEEAKNISEPIPDGETTEAFIQMCRSMGCYLVAGMAEIEDENVYNSAMLVGPDGFVGVYRKVHLFCEERNWFLPGNRGFHVWDIGIAKIGIMICFDWIFPEAARSLAIQGADVICHPTNLVLPYCQDAMITRSIENRVYTVTANRIGSEKRGEKKRLTFTGGSQIVDPKGRLLFRLKKEEEAFKETRIDPGSARDKQITETNHLWKDIRPDQYRLPDDSHVSSDFKG